MTISDFLQGKFQIELTKENVNSAFVEIRDLSAVFIEFIEDAETGDIEYMPKVKDEDAWELDIKWFEEKGRDLMVAQVYYFLSSYISGGGERVTRGQLTVTEANYTIGITDRKQFKELAEALYAKWVEIIPEDMVVVFPSM